MVSLKVGSFLKTRSFNAKNASARNSRTGGPPREGKGLFGRKVRGMLGGHAQNIKPFRGLLPRRRAFAKATVALALAVTRRP
ncbi:MAG: hypothetical protein COA65_08080 [Rhodospirillaceae bacterium]|nr:MAG: hypothetical protein COA65_08080 [Rhodospirillaceae bacterium]